MGIFLPSYCRTLPLLSLCSKSSVDIEVGARFSSVKISSCSVKAVKRRYLLPSVYHFSIALESSWPSCWMTFTLTVRIIVITGLLDRTLIMVSSLTKFRYFSHMQCGLLLDIWVSFMSCSIIRQIDNTMVN